MSMDWADILRARGVETDLLDADLTSYANAAVAEIAARGLGPQTDVVVNAVGIGQTLIALDPPAAAISEVIEDDVELDADADGYRLRPGGSFVERLSAGRQVGWWGVVKVTLDTSPSDDRYERVVTDLVKLALQYSGLDSRRDGDYAEESLGARGGGQKSYQDERDILIRELMPVGIGFA